MSSHSNHEPYCEDGRISLDSLIITAELGRRASRAPDYQAENRALLLLCQTMITTPEMVLQRLVQVAMETCKAHSAGVSLLERDEQGNEVFRWVAVAGEFAANLGGSITRNLSPCGVVLERNAVLLIRYPERYFKLPIKVEPPVVEALLSPFHCKGKPVGTVWVIAHEESREFDNEDARMMQDLGKFASSAYQILDSFEALVNSEKRLNALVRASSGAIYRMSADWSEMRQLRSDAFLSQSETTRTNWLQRYIPPEDQFRVMQSVNKAIQTRSAFDLEHQVWRPDGSVGWAHSRAVPLFDASGNIAEWFGAATDITEHRQAQTSLIRHEKLAATGRLAATIAHEVNNPLAGATNALYLASSDPGLRPETREYLRIADHELRRASHVTRQALGFYRETGHRGPVSISRLIDEVVDLYSGKLKDGNIAVHRERKGDGRSENDWVVGNAGELRQIISNILANGIDALHENGALYLRITRTGTGAGQEIHLTIADNGSGIRRGNLQYIFEPFFTTKEATGTGLGLWVTRELVREHSGSIKVRSKEGQGTVFRISLPAAA